MIVEITDANFDSILLNTSKPIVLDFWAPRYGPCRMISPYFDELAEEFKTELVVGKVNVDTNSNLAMRFGVRSIPTILYLNEGIVVDKQVGATTKKVLVDKVNQKLFDN